MSNCRGYDEFFEHYGFLVAEIKRTTLPGRLTAVHCMDVPTPGKSGANERIDAICENNWDNNDPAHLAKLSNAVAAGSRLKTAREEFLTDLKFERVIDGISLDDNKKNRLEIRKEVGMVFQQFNLFPHLTVLDNLCLAPQWVRKLPRREAEAIAMRYLERVRCLMHIDACAWPDNENLHAKPWEIPSPLVVD